MFFRYLKACMKMPYGCILTFERSVLLNLINQHIQKLIESCKNLYSFSETENAANKPIQNSGHFVKELEMRSIHHNVDYVFLANPVHGKLYFYFPFSEIFYRKTKLREVHLYQGLRV